MNVYWLCPLKSLGGGVYCHLLSFWFPFNLQGIAIRPGLNVLPLGGSQSGFPVGVEQETDQFSPVANDPWTKKNNKSRDGFQQGE